MKAIRRWGFLAAVLLLGAGSAWAQTDPTAPVEMDTLEVIGVTPVGGAGLPMRQMATNAQVVRADQVAGFRPLDVTEALGARLGSVHLSNLGGNPFQPDVSYRGFRGSPLLGLPQGLSVFLDGARVNETFGDIVNWDLIPQTALARVELLPGSNPAFGLNTLGGALVLKTKSGTTAPGARLRTYGGSHRRFAGEGEIGGQAGPVGYYAAGEAFREDGWRDFSNSDVQTVFAKGSWLGDRTTVDVSALGATSRLRGNGAVPVELLARDRAAVFTHPDETTNALGLLTVTATHQVSEGLQLSGTLYGRGTRTETFNGDDSDYGACPLDFAASGVAQPSDALCFGGEEEGEDEEARDDEDGDEPRQVFDRNGDPVRATDAVTTATNNTTDTDQGRLGLSLQLAWTQDLAGTENRLVVGGSADAGWVDFFSQTELARLTDARGTVGSGIVDGESLTEVDTRARSASLYAVNMIRPLRGLTLTVSGRLNAARVILDDQIGTALNGDHSFFRINPAAGAAYQVHPSVSLFANWSVSNRAPTPVELTCADPDAPCRLPNGFQADPPLEQVVAETMSAGVRGQVAGVAWAVSAFRTDARNDIYFISAGPFRNSGFFDNVGTTRRQGVEAMAHGTVADRLDWFAAYTFLDATFQTAFRVNAPNHPLADEGEITVAAGNRLPLTPRHVGKLGADLALTSRLSISNTILWQGRQTIRGDESNQLAPLDAFAIWNLEATARLFDHWTLFGKVDNLLNLEYKTAGLLGEPDEVDAFEDFENPRFVTPGHPRLIRLGIGYRF